MKTSESIKEITKALLIAQKSIGAAKKSGKNPHFQSTFANLGDVMEACKTILNDNGITILQPIMGATLETMLLHETGEWMMSETPIVAKAPNDPQAMGSAITYARRYGLQSMVFIPAEDDDGQKASTVAVKAAQPPSATAPRQYWDAKAQKPVPVKPCQMCGGVGKHVQGCPDNI